MSQEQILRSIAELLEANGLTPEDLIAQRGAGGSVPASAPTLAEFVARASRGLSVNTFRSYRTHFTHLLEGIARQCECTCATCVREFARTGACACGCAQCARAEAFPALAEVRLTRRSVDEMDLDLFVRLVQCMAVKRAMHDNVVRASRGLSAKPAHGQGAREMAVTALRFLFGRMVARGIIPASPAAELDKGRRSASRRRALDEPEFAELFEVVVAGGDDPELDLAITWAEFELGARRNGLITLSVGLLDRVAQTVGLHEKGGVLAYQPCSLELIDFLLAHAQARGGNRCRPGHPDYDPSAAVLYYRDSTPERPHAVTARRFDTLHRRVQLALPWARSIAYTGHDLRHTLGTMVERDAGFETARRALRHTGTETTSTYTKASARDVARAVARITGRSHPLVDPTPDGPSA